ncbi:hypothetical protein NEAUS06_0049 [Nematocida ausubeli]|nr:hypothetical protein NEAUS06_0049 [Nematocida ausubeli]
MGKETTNGVGQKKIDEMTNKLLREGVIELSRSRWCNPVKIVEKPDGSLRLCQNLRKLNTIVEDDKYSLPEIEGILVKVGQKKWFTVLDLKDGYFQIRLHKDSREKTAFKLKNRLYQCKRLVMGYKNSPAIFQRIMDKELDGVIGNGCEVYLDDIIVYGNTEKEHDENLDRVMRRLDKADLRVKEVKMQYRRQEVLALGHIINGETGRPKEDKVEEMRRWAMPETKEELRRFLGFINHYSRYIKDFANKTAELYDKMKEGSKFEMRQQDKETVERLKEEFATAKLDTWVDGREIVLTTDASGVAAGRILSQIDEKGNERIIAFGSYKFKSAERNYGITERELYAMVLGIEKYEHYLRGRKFTVIVDHRALECWNRKMEFGSERIQRWMHRIDGFNMVVKYRKGSEMTAVDALSRREQMDVEKTTERETEYGISSKSKYWVRIQWKNGTPWIEGADGLDRRLIKTRMKTDIMNRAHEETGHGGMEKMRDWIETDQESTWVGLKTDLLEKVKSCEKCQKNNQKRSISKGKFIETGKALEMVGMDVMGPVEEHNLVCVLDYFTRIVMVRAKKGRGAADMIAVMEEWIQTRGKPEKLVTDTAKEYVADKWMRFLEKTGIENYRGSIEVHATLRRVERVIKSVWEIYRKIGTDGELKDRVQRIENAINGRRHDGIGMKPNEAWEIAQGQQDAPGRVAQAQHTRGENAGNGGYENRQKDAPGRVAQAQYTKGENAGNGGYTHRQKDAEEGRADRDIRMDILREKNSAKGEYARKRFQEEKDEAKAKEGETVWFRKKPENKKQDRFPKEGKVDRVTEEGTYLVTEADTGKKSKISHRRIKRKVI